MSVIMVSKSHCAAVTLQYCAEKAKDDKNRCTLMESDLESSSARKLARTWEAERKGWGKNEGVQCSHTVYSLNPKDPKSKVITDRELADIGHEFVAKVAPNHSYAIFVHRDRDHPHVHIVWSAINGENGKKFQMGPPDLKRAKSIKDDIDKAHGLEITKPMNIPERVPIAARRLMEQGRDGYSFMLDLQNRISDAADKARSFEKFREILKSDGVEINLRQNKNMTFSFVDKQGKLRQSRHQKLGDNYSYESIVTRIETRNHELERAQLQRDLREATSKEAPRRNDVRPAETLGHRALKGTPQRGEELSGSNDTNHPRSPDIYLKQLREELRESSGTSQSHRDAKEARLDGIIEIIDESRKRHKPNKSMQQPTEPSLESADGRATASSSKAERASRIHTENIDTARPEKSHREPQRHRLPSQPDSPTASAPGRHQGKADQIPMDSSRGDLLSRDSFLGKQHLPDTTNPTIKTTSRERPDILGQFIFTTNKGHQETLNIVRGIPSVHYTQDSKKPPEYFYTLVLEGGSFKEATIPISEKEAKDGVMENIIREKYRTRQLGAFLTERFERLEQLTKEHEQPKKVSPAELLPRIETPAYKFSTGAYDLSFKTKEELESAQKELSQAQKSIETKGKAENLSYTTTVIIAMQQQEATAENHTFVLREQTRSVPQAIERALEVDRENLTKHGTSALFNVDSTGLITSRDFHVARIVPTAEYQIKAVQSQIHQQNTDKLREKNNLQEIHKLAQEKHLTIMEPGKMTRHTGEIVASNSDYILQKTGDNRAVLHSTKALDRTPQQGMNTTIQYSNGKGKVQEKTKSKGIEMEI